MLRIIISLGLSLVIGISNIYAQNSIISVLTNGVGSTKISAVENALRNSISVITKKEKKEIDEIISNNDLLKLCNYQIVSVDSSKRQIYNVTLRVKIDLNKVSMVSDNHGKSIYSFGNNFALRIDQLRILEESEFHAANSILSNCEQLAFYAYNYGISMRTPSLKDEKTNVWQVNFDIQINPNITYQKLIKYLTATLTSLSMNDSDLKEYETINKKYYPISVSINGELERYYFRNKKSARTIEMTFQIIEGFKDFYFITGENFFTYGNCSDFLQKYFSNYMPHRNIETKEIEYSFLHSNYFSNETKHYSLSSKPFHTQFQVDMSLEEIKNMKNISIEPLSKEGILFISNGFFVTYKDGIEIKYLISDVRVLSEEVLSFLNSKERAYPNNKWKLIDYLEKKNHGDILKKIRNITDYSIYIYTNQTPKN